MKKLLLAMILSLGVAMANDDIDAADKAKALKEFKKSHFVSQNNRAFDIEKSTISKKGFVTSQSCADAGLFKDCKLDSFSNDTMLLYVHDENKFYKINLSEEMKLSAFDHAIRINDVKLYGDIDEVSGAIVVAGLAAPKGPAKTFFKGCM